MLYMYGMFGLKKIECPKLRELIWKLCTLYVWNVWICLKMEYAELRKLNWKLRTIYMYKMSARTAYITCTECIDL